MPKLEELRKQIREIDTEIIAALARRQTLSKQIGHLKLSQDKEIIDLSQEKELFVFYETLSKQYNLKQIFVERLFKVIIAYSRMVQIL